MKHIKLFEQFIQNLETKQYEFLKNRFYEGINYKYGINADLYDVGIYVINNQGIKKPDSTKEIEKIALNAMGKGRPIPLSGKIKKDLPLFLKYISSIFKKYDVDLDTNNTIIDSSNFSNELMVPVKNTDYYFNTFLDYDELAYSGSDFVIGGSFASDEVGSIGYNINDLSKDNEVSKACKIFRDQYLMKK
jgi:hypothetical protein